MVSFAGKVAIETAYCVSIPWRSGRPDCTADQPEQGPSGSITTLKEFQPFLDRYGFSAKEMGVLLSGAHGLKDSVIRNEKGDVIMAFKTSGTQWISETVEEAVWIFYNGTREFEPLFLGSNAVGRLPVDMVFFPTILKEKSSPAFGHKKFEIDDSKEAYEIEEYLERFIPYEAKFNREFARVFSKMLAIGTDGKGELYQDETLNC